MFFVVAFIVAGLGIALFGDNQTGNFVGPAVGLFAGLWAASRLEN